MNNAQKTLVCLWLAAIERYARRTVDSVDDLRPGQYEQEWQSIKDCLEEKAKNTESRMGDTWALAVLGGASPSWVLGIQAPM